MSTPAATVSSMTRSVRLPRAASRRSPVSRERRRFVRLIVFGFFWAIIASMIELSNVPFESIDDPMAVARVVASFATHDVVASFIIASALFWATIGTTHWLRILAAVFVAAIASSTLVSFTPLVTVFSQHDEAVTASISARQPVLPLFTYLAWVYFVYGGFGAVIYGLRLRIDQTTRVLRSATLARERTETAIAEARVQAMVERIEPTFLLEAMSAARTQYAIDRERAEAIINGLVRFLRVAMPQIRTGQSTLALELDVAESFLALRALIAIGPISWRFVHDDQAGHEHEDGLAAVPLPPLVLLPLLERFTAEDSCSLTIAAVHEAGTAVLTIRGPASRRLSAEDIEAIGLRVRRTCGAGARLDERIDDAGAAYRLSVPLTATPARGADQFPIAQPVFKEIRK